MALPTLTFKHFLTYDEVAAFLRKLADARPELARLESIGESRDGRDLFLLTVTDFDAGAPEDKPAFLVHGNIHASELSGTHAALYTARKLLADHARNKQLLQQVAFHIVPRINPDGAEQVVQTHGAVRSRMEINEREPNTLYQGDVDGDGLVLDMIWEHPDGNLVKDPKAPELLITRRADSKPPYYRKVIEGVVHDWDGSEDFKVHGRSIDWNRQWGYNWKPEPEQSGAGDFPYSEPEMRCLAQFMAGHTNLFGVIGYHNGPAGALRPPSTGTDDQLDAGDLRTYEDLMELATKHTGFPEIPVYKYHSERSRHINLYGHFASTGYYHFGLLAMEFELGMIYDSAGFDADKIFATRNQDASDARMRKVYRWWKKQGEPCALFHPWAPFEHPQLGPVEIGGVDRMFMAGPLLSDLKKRCDGTYKFTRAFADKHPLVTVEDVEAEAVGDGIIRLRARVANRGELPTHICLRGKSLKRLRSVRLRMEPGDGVEVLSQSAHHTLGHLGGITGSQRLEWFLRAPDGGSCELVVTGGAGGNVRQTVPL